jgi:hypothetical protein
LETALLTVDRENFYLIEKVSLHGTVKITFEIEGNFATDPKDVRIREPDNHVADYLIRTAFSSSVLLNRDRKKILAQLTKPENQKIRFLESEAEIHANTWKQKRDNIFNITSFCPNYLYGFYHKQVEDQLKEKKTKGENVVEYHSKVYQGVMVASMMVKEMLKDLTAYQKPAKDKESVYIEVFGSMEEAKKGPSA